MAMGFLKNLLIEEEEKEFDEKDYYYEEEPVIEAELEEVNRDTLIEDIYKENGVEDKSQSIFKVEEIMNSLPKEMATTTKQATVKGIMASFGLTAEMVVCDGENRIGITTAVANKVKESCEGEIAETKIKIEEHKQEIERLEKVISEAETDMKVCREKVDAECERIKALIDFIIGGE